MFVEIKCFEKKFRFSFVRCFFINKILVYCLFVKGIKIIKILVEIVFYILFFERFLLII